MMQCHIKDKRLHVPEYIIPMQLFKAESWFVRINSKFILKCLSS